MENYFYSIVSIKRNNDSDVMHEVSVTSYFYIADNRNYDILITCAAFCFLFWH